MFSMKPPSPSTAITSQPGLAMATAMAFGIANPIAPSPAVWYIRCECNVGNASRKISIA